LARKIVAGNRVVKEELEMDDDEHEGPFSSKLVADNEVVVC